MDTIRESVKIICMAAIALALIKILLPEKSSGKQIGLLISLIFIFVLVTPFVGGNISINTETVRAQTDIDYSEFEKQVMESLRLQTGNIISTKLSNKLNENKISIEKITVLTNISDNNCITISKVICVVFDESQMSDAERIIKEEADESTEIIIQKSEE